MSKWRLDSILRVSTPSPQRWPLAFAEHGLTVSFERRGDLSDLDRVRSVTNRDAPVDRLERVDEPVCQPAGLAPYFFFLPFLPFLHLAAIETFWLLVSAF